jgi:hypothetical protein
LTLCGSNDGRDAWRFCLGIKHRYPFRSGQPPRLWAALQIWFGRGTFVLT